MSGSGSYSNVGGEIVVIIGNPPYNVGQINENDNNKNRAYPALDQCIRTTYARDSQATLHTKLYDMYVRFFRWATEELGERDGVICFVTNNGFLDGVAFDGFRKHLGDDFSHIYHLDLGGNVRKRGGGSVFGIRVGVGITLLVRKRAGEGDRAAIIRYYAVDDTWSGTAKVAALEEVRDYRGVPWKPLQPDARYTWMTHGLRAEFDGFLPMGTKAAKTAKPNHAPTIFGVYSLGVATNRDAWVYDVDSECLTKKMRRFIENYNEEVTRYAQQQPGSESVDSFVNTDKRFIKWTDRLKIALRNGYPLTFEPNTIRRSLYRPFCQKYLYFDHILNQRRHQQHRIFPTPESERENVVICVSSIGHRAPFTVLATAIIPNLTLNTIDGFQCFPFYIYDADGTNRQENITDWALEQFQARCGHAITKWDIFYYVYAVLHHPTYRLHYAENLKRDLPSIPVPTSAEMCALLVTAGKTLVNLHVGYEQASMYPLTVSDIGDRSVDSWRVEKMRVSPDRQRIIVNPWLTLAGIPAECFDYQLGNRSALEWVIDQYQVTTDRRSGIVNDPNRPEDQDYIMNLVRRVVRVSVETVGVVRDVAGTELVIG